MKRIYLILICFVSTINLFSQRTESELKSFIESSSEAELVKESTFLMMEGYYYDAEKVIDKLITLKPESSNYNYRKGYVVLFSRKDYKASIPFLKKAIVSVSKSFDIYSANEKSAPVDAIYYLATSYHALEQIDNAKKEYNSFIEKTDKKSDLIPEAKLRLQQCDIAAKLIGEPNKGVAVQNVGNIVNSTFPEYSAVVALDGSALFYTSRKPWGGDTSQPYFDRKSYLYTEDIYVSYIDENEQWQKPERISFCNPESNEATVAVNAAERRIYTYKDETGNGDIYYSDFSGNKFNSAKIFDVKDVNTSSWEPHLMISSDGKTMYFVSNRPGGYGGRDIYEMKRQSNGSWGEPKNMGPTINSAYDEDSPFVSVDGKYLYYSTNGPKSMGGFDILYSRKTGEDQWSESVNIGYPINSCGDDLYYTTTVDGYLGFFTSFRQDGLGEKDIYQVVNNYLGVENISFLKVKIKTVDNLPIPEDLRIVLKCRDCDDKKENIVFPRLRDGLVITSMEPCKTYDVSYQLGADQKEIHHEVIKTECGLAYQEIDREYLVDLKKRKIVTVEKVDTEVPVLANKQLEMINFFKYNDNKLFLQSREFKKFMSDLEEQLKASTGNLTIKIYSSASQVPTRKYKDNQELANLRAENMKYDVVTHLQKKTNFSNRVNVVIVESSVNGPTYEHDGKNKEKYAPFQFVKLKTE